MVEALSTEVARSSKRELRAGGHVLPRTLNTKLFDLSDVTRPRRASCHQFSAMLYVDEENVFCATS